MNVLRQAAMDYARRGWPVFPVAPGGKLPAIPSAHKQGDPERGVCRGECGRHGHGLYDATIDTDVIDRWWTATPDANIGIRTGVMFDVLDIDDWSGIDALNAHRRGRDTPWGPESQTSSGFHQLYLPTGHGNRAGVVPKVDWRGQGGYIVAPPSRHPTGHIYAWCPGSGPDEPIPPTPDWLLELLRRPDVVPAPSGTSSAAPSDAYARRALESEVGRLLLTPVGQRNDQLNRSAFNLGQLVAAGKLDLEQVAETLLDAAHRIGLTDREIVPSIRSGLQAGMRHPRRIAS